MLREKNLTDKQSASRIEAVNNFIYYLNKLKELAIIKDTNFDETNDNIKLLNIYPLNVNEEKIMEKLWKTGQYAYTKEEIQRLVEMDEHGFSAALKSMVIKNYLLKSWFIDNTKPFWKKLKVLYTILVPYQFYSNKLRVVINELIKDDNILHVSICSDSLDQQQIERIRRICDGAELD